MRSNLQRGLADLLKTNELTEVFWKFKPVLKTVVAFSVVTNLLMLAPAIYMMQIYDRVLASRNENTLLVLSALILGLFALSSLIEQYRSMVVIRVGEKIDAIFNKRIYQAAFEQNLKTPGFNAAQSLNDLTTIRQFVTGNALFAFIDAPWFPIYLIVIFLFSAWLGLFAFICVAALFALAWYNESATKTLLANANSLSVQSTTLAANSLRNAEVIQAMGMVGNIQNRWFELHQQFLDFQSIASEKGAKITALSKFVRVSVQSLILGVAAFLVIAGDLTAGMMIAASVLLGRALAPVEQIIAAWRQWSGVVSAYKRLITLLAANPVRAVNMRLPKPSGQLSVESIVAAPPGVKLAVLKNISFGLNKGDVLSVVGPSGSGKSTLARAIVGVWPTASGKVRLDGAEVYHWDSVELGPNIGYLPQDIELFSGTISENISRFGGVDPEKVVAAATMAGVHDLILRLPNGYDTVIGDGGAGLSGGQKQRIGLARALYGEPVLFVLDEPNSNLDEAGELALLAAIKQLKELGRTTVVISHKLNVIQLSTKLLILQEGAIQSYGNTQEVLTNLAKAKAEAQSKVQSSPQTIAVPSPGQNSL
jgi:ATP-binding cassette subfamily C exporter for protease/lipase